MKNTVSATGGMRGFSLIELMVALVIAAIIMGLALPAYTGYMQKTRRTDAKVKLTTIANQQERYYLKNNGYAPSITALGYSDSGCDGGGTPSVTSDEGYYCVIVTQSGSNDFLITASGIGVQADDDDCATFTLRDTGQKAALTAESVDNSDECW